MAEQKYERDTHNTQKSFQATRAAATDVYKTGIDLFQRGIERNIEVQKNALDVAVQLNTETLDLWRTVFQNFPGAEPMFTLAEQMVDTFIETHRRALDIMGQQSNEVAESAKAQGERTARASVEIKESAQREREKTA